MAILLHTPAEVATELAIRVRTLRLARRWTQAELAMRAGVALSTLKVFEHGGRISLERLLRIAAALDDLDSFSKVLQPPRARSLDELEARADVSRKYGRSMAAAAKNKPVPAGTEKTFNRARRRHDAS